MGTNRTVEDKLPNKSPRRKTRTDRDGGIYTRPPFLVGRMIGTVILLRDGE